MDRAGSRRLLRGRGGYSLESRQRGSGAAWQCGGAGSHADARADSDAGTNPNAGSQPDA
jgi:hypothetical protein